MRNQGSWPDTAVKPGFTGPAESQTRVQTADNNRKQGSEGANTAKTGSGDPQTRDEGSQVSKRGKQGFPGLAKRQTRVSQRLRLRVRVVLSLVHLSTEIANFWRSV